MEQTKKSPRSIIAGVLFSVSAVWYLWYLWYLIFHLGHSFRETLFMWPHAVSLALIGVSLFIRKEKLLMIGSLILVVLQVQDFILKLSGGSYFHAQSGYHGAYKFKFICMLPYLLECIAYIAFFCLAVVVSIGLFAGLKEKVKKLWFLPGTLLLVSFLLTAFLVWRSEYTYGFSWGPALPILIRTKYMYPTDALLWKALLAVSVFVCGSWLAYPIKMPKIKTEQTGTVYSSSYGYFNLSAHVVLLLFTFGIWNYIWIYRTTDYLNIVKSEPPRNPVTKLLLCMFVPFYSIYWTYISAQRIDKLAAENGISSDISVICLILSIFVGIVPPILMQVKINEVVTSPSYKERQSAKTERIGEVYEANAYITCSECGEKVSKNFKYCPNCSKQL